MLLTRQYSAAIAASVCSLVLVGCDSIARVKGFVQDPQGNPVNAARIHLAYMDGKASQNSNQDGCFSAIELIPGPSRSRVPLTIEVAGYKTVSAQVRNGAEIVVTLAPVDSATASHIRMLESGDRKKLARCGMPN
jgi:hypothetical protein